MDKKKVQNHSRAAHSVQNTLKQIHKIQHRLRGLFSTTYINLLDTLTPNSIIWKKWEI